MRVVVLGAGFAGLAAAVHARSRLPDSDDVVVLSPRDEFVHVPLLLHTALGLEVRIDEASTPVRAVLARHRIGFREVSARRIDLDGHRVLTDAGDEPYDRLIVAAGTEPDEASVPGLAAPTRHAHSYMSPVGALGTRDALAALRTTPGPLLVGLTEGASAFGSAYRFALHVAHELRTRAPVTLVTPEPFAGHLGLGGAGYASDELADALDELGVRVETDARIAQVTPGSLLLDDGRSLPFALAVVTPREVPPALVRSCEPLLGDDGFVRIDGLYRAGGRDDVFAAGSVVSIPPRERTRVRCGVPHTPSMSAEMGAIAGDNAAASAHGGALSSRPPQELIADRLDDGGAGENITVADPFLDPRSSAWSRVHPDLERIELVLERMHALGSTPLWASA